jgi:hypothetical protein
MRWGVRKSEHSVSDGGKNVKVRSAFGNRVVVATGGAKRDLSDDAKKAAVNRQVAKKSNVRSLSNKELQDLVTRMNLEQQYSDLEKKKRKQTSDRLERGKEVALQVISAVTKASS